MIKYKKMYFKQGRVNRSMYWHAVHVTLWSNDVVDNWPASVLSLDFRKACMTLTVHTYPLVQRKQQRDVVWNEVRLHPDERPTNPRRKRHYTQTRGLRTLGEDAVHVEAVGGAGLVEEGVTHIDAQLPGPLVIDHPRVAARDFVLNKGKIKRNCYVLE